MSDIDLEYKIPEGMLDQKSDDDLDMGVPKENLIDIKLNKIDETILNSLSKASDLRIIEESGWANWSKTLWSK